MRKPYNKRLFSGGIRKWIHTARFVWLKKMQEKYHPNMRFVVELGCFDCRSLEYLTPPAMYYGFDAGWEGGLDAARGKYSDTEYHLIECRTADELQVPEKATLFISLETLEHIPEQQLEEYLKQITNIAGEYLFISVPNEKGPLFAFKHIAKLLMGNAENYRFLEFMAAAFGRLEHVKRKEHKGFDWEVLQKRLEKDYIPIEISGVQSSVLPLWANFQIGMVYKVPPK